MRESLAIVAFVGASLLSVLTGPTGKVRFGGSAAHAKKDWRSTVPKPGRVHCAPCGRCGINTKTVGPICAKMGLSTCSGSFGTFLNALTKGCRSKKFTDLFGLDGLTFGIRHSWSRNMPGLMKQFLKQDRALVQRLFRNAGISQWLKGSKVDEEWFRTTQLENKGLYCHAGFRDALQASTREPALIKAQAMDAWSRLKRFSKDASRYFTSSYGKVAWAVIRNNSARCSVPKLAEACKQHEDEVARVECFIDRFVQKKCRGNEAGSKRRARYIRAAFPTDASRRVPFSLESLDTIFARCGVGSVIASGAPVTSEPVVTSEPPPSTTRPTQVSSAPKRPISRPTSSGGSDEPGYCSVGRMAKLAVRIPRLSARAPARLKAFRLGDVVIAGMAVGSATNRYGARSVQAVAEGLSSARGADKHCTWYLYHRSKSKAAASAFRHAYVSRPSKPGYGAKYLRQLGGALGTGDGSFLACARKHGYIGLGGSSMRDRGPAVFAMLLAISGCTPRHAVQISERYWGRYRSDARAAIAKTGFEFGQRNTGLRRELSKLFSGGKGKTPPTIVSGWLKKLGFGG